ncbi:hypothetical protein BS50DRAFT_630770 [Corynespora cassiicola Philippines]|uniref:Uncharacterized protein n=1 Tax=Corynespora cassiicola Philippines TaxID=1448308 RepID=A0A2T2P012_CORCC|nr:hypothetical protein BS50DRAFT_630770 [Corynespora cassiicola Philippines]
MVNALATGELLSFFNLPLYLSVCSSLNRYKSASSPFFLQLLFSSDRLYSFFTEYAFCPIACQETHPPYQLTVLSSRTTKLLIHCDGLLFLHLICIRHVSNSPRHSSTPFDIQSVEMFSLTTARLTFVLAFLMKLLEPMVDEAIFIILSEVFTMTTAIINVFLGLDANNTPTRHCFLSAMSFWTSALAFGLVDTITFSAVCDLTHWSCLAQAIMATSVFAAALSPFLSKNGLPAPTTVAQDVFETRTITSARRSPPPHLRHSPETVAAAASAARQRELEYKQRKELAEQQEKDRKQSPPRRQQQQHNFRGRARNINSSNKKSKIATPGVASPAQAPNLRAEARPNPWANWAQDLGADDDALIREQFARYEEETKAGYKPVMIFREAWKPTKAQ